MLGVAWPDDPSLGLCKVRLGVVHHQAGKSGDTAPRLETERGAC